MGAPTQVPSVGVTVMAELMAAEVVLAEVKAGIAPLPDDERPVLVLVFVQLSVAPAGVLIKSRIGRPTAGHTTVSGGSMIEGRVLMVTFNGALGPSQLSTVCET